jgi:hypothetical protein
MLGNPYPLPLLKRLEHLNTPPLHLPQLPAMGSHTPMSPFNWVKQLHCLPTTVVVGDQLRGKSSVLELLASISLPCRPVSVMTTTACTTMSVAELSGTSMTVDTRRGRERQDSQHQVIHGDDLDIRCHHWRWRQHQLIRWAPLQWAGDMPMELPTASGAPSSPTGMGGSLGC